MRYLRRKMSAAHNYPRLTLKKSTATLIVKIKAAVFLFYLIISGLVIRIKDESHGSKTFVPSELYTIPFSE